MLLNTLLAVIVFFTSLSLTAQGVHEPTNTNPDWSKPYEPFRIVGNIYYVGTYDLGCYLVTSKKGNILINTGLAGSASQIKNNIEKLGFKMSDTKIFLTTQAHYDHVGALADIKKMTGAKVMVDEPDAAVLADGGASDFAFGGKGAMFQPVKADRLLHDHDIIQLGETKLELLHHPGHTKGSCSFMLTTKDEKRSYKVLIANMPTVVVEKNFEEVTSYPTIARDYDNTFKAMKNLSFDIWLASHASQFKMHTKHKPGDAYKPEAFVDRAGYDELLADLEKQYNEHLNRH